MQSTLEGIPRANLIIEKTNPKVSLKKKDNKINYMCNCDLDNNKKHKENCIYNLV